MAFEKVDFELQKGCLIVQGENRDDQGQESNGGGKTSFVDIVPIALMGQSLDSRNLKRCVKRDSDDKFFVVSVEMSHSDGRVAKISRKVYNNTKNAELYITVNDNRPVGVPCTDDKIDVNGGNKWILEEMLGITKEDLLSYYMISAQHYKSYFKATANAKIEIINRFSNADKVDLVIDELKNEAKYAKEWVERLERDINHMKGLNDQLQEALNNRPDYGDANLILSEYDAKKKEFEEVEQHLLHMTNTNEELEEVSKKYNETQGVENELTKQRNEIDAMAASLKTKLAGMVECPKCGTKFNPTIKEPTQDWGSMLQEVFDMREQVQEDIIIQQGVLTNFYNRIKEIESEIRAHKQMMYAKRDALKQQIGLLHGKVQEINTEKEQVSKIQVQMDWHNDQISQYQNTMSEQVKEFESKAEWQKRFEDFKFFLANKPINVISGLINHYLQKNQSEMKVFIEGFKRLKNGTLKPQLNPIIYRNSEEALDYNEFSGGERVRLNIAADLAFQELINSGSKSGGLNYYSNDELMNGLDSLGISNAANAFNSLNKTILLVSHSGADMHYEQTVKIIKEGGVSKVS